MKNHIKNLFPCRGVASVRSRVLPALTALLNLFFAGWLGAQSVYIPYTFTTLAGAAPIGSADGTGSAARFYLPSGVATDSSGNVYVADTINNNTIRKITPAGVPLARAHAGANLLTNGSFEDGNFVPDGNGYQSKFPGSTDITGWTVTSSEVAWAWDAIVGDLTASDGTHFLDLTGYHDSPPYGGVSQTIDTIIGRTYTVSFDLGDSAKSWFYQGPVSILASAGSAGGVFTLGPSAGGNLWQNYSYSFRATSSATDIAFTGVQGIFYIGLDNASVTVEPVPLALATVAPLFAIAQGGINRFILSPNNADADVVLDGSQSSDSDNDPLQFCWFADGQTNALATGALVTNQFAVGPHTVQLVVSDGHDIATAQVSFEVITPATAVSQLMAVVDEASLGSRKKQPLLATLSAAMSAFERGNFTAALNQLSAFQNEVRAQIAPWNPALASECTAASQKISDVVSGR